MGALVGPLSRLTFLLHAAANLWATVETMVSLYVIR